MPDFKNFNDLEKFLKKNPEVVMQQNIGKLIEYECPVCKAVERIRIISGDKGLCLNCNNEMSVHLVIG